MTYKMPTTVNVTEKIHFAKKDTYRSHSDGHYQHGLEFPRPPQPGPRRAYKSRHFNAAGENKSHPPIGVRSSLATLHTCPEGMAAGASKHGKIGHDLGFPVTNNGGSIRSTNGAANAPLCVDVIIEKLLERRDSQKQASYQENRHSVEGHSYN